MMFKGNKHLTSRFVMRFRDRTEAGQLLATALLQYRHEPAVIYALPRGGVVLGVEIAKRLQAPLDVLVPRKIGHPDNPEYAVCAVAENGYLVCNQPEAARLDKQWLNEAVKAQQAEARRRRQNYAAGRSEPSVRGKTAIITDDGVATGLTMMAAIMDARARRPAKIVVAVPVLPRDVAADLRERVDEVVALDIPAVYHGAVGAYYDQFDQVEDETVKQLLNR